MEVLGEFTVKDPGTRYD